MCCTRQAGPGDQDRRHQHGAFAAHVLAELGGFDPAFAFYLDETDLNLRLAAARAMRRRLCRWPQVHHGFAAIARRRGDRMPRDLFDIGASHAVFLRKHAPPRPIRAGALAPAAGRTARAAVAAYGGGHAGAARCAPAAGNAGGGNGDGPHPAIADAAADRQPSEPFQPFCQRRHVAGAVLLAGRPWHAAQPAREAARAGCRGPARQPVPVQPDRAVSPRPVRSARVLGAAWRAFRAITSGRQAWCSALWLRRPGCSVKSHALATCAVYEFARYCVRSSCNNSAKMPLKIARFHVQQMS